MRFSYGFRVSPGRRGSPALAVLLAGLGWLGATAPAKAQAAGEAAEGETLFKARCAVCHTIGGGSLVGPDLEGVTARRPQEWITRWIEAPDRMLAAGDPTAKQLYEQFHNVPMPNLGLDPSQVAGIITYLASASKASAAAPAGQTAAPAAAPAVAPRAALPAGDPSIGKALFVGERRFENGGPPCMGCHSVAGIGALGGGALGPDLTPAYHKYGGDAGLASFLAGAPTATMNAVWSRQPLNESEQADLLAFLKQASVSGRPIEALGRLAALAVGGTLILLGVAQLRWRKRLIAVRRPLVDRMRRGRAA